MADQSCLFCRIVEKTIPAKIIDENDKVLAFHDINPMAPMHALVIPKTHIAHLAELSSDTALYVGEMMLMAKKIAHEHGESDQAFRVVFNTRSEAGQTVFHLHAHLMWGRDFSWPPG